MSPFLYIEKKFKIIFLISDWNLKCRTNHSANFPRPPRWSLNQYIIESFMWHLKEPGENKRFFP